MVKLNKQPDMSITNIFSKYYQLVFGAVSCLMILLLIDKALATAVAFAITLAVLSLLAFKAAGFNTKTICALFIISLLLHGAAVIFVHYTGFQPFSGKGDYELYDSIAKVISERLHNGNFSIGDTGLGSWYPVIIGYIYAVLGPNMFFGQIFNAWTAALAAALVYLIVAEIGRSEKEAFLTGLASNFYPSLLFFSSYLLKDVLVVTLCLFGLWMAVKLIKSFSWVKFAVFYAGLVVLTNLRFYASFALILTFIFCWFVFSG